jgi:hypothetical protein
MNFFGPPAQEEGKLTDSNQYLILPIPIIKVLLEQWGRVIVKNSEIYV